MDWFYNLNCLGQIYEHVCVWCVCVRIGYVRHVLLCIFGLSFGIFGYLSTMSLFTKPVSFPYCSVLKENRGAVYLVFDDNLELKVRN